MDPVFAFYFLLLGSGPATRVPDVPLPPLQLDLRRPVTAPDPPDPALLPGRGYRDHSYRREDDETIPRGSLDPR